MKLYRLYTENTGQTPKEVAKLLKAYGFSGATILYGIGIYKSQVEKSLIIEIVDDDNSLYDIANIIRGMAYNILNRWIPQESVMLVLPDNTVEFVTKGEAEK